VTARSRDERQLIGDLLSLINHATTATTTTTRTRRPVQYAVVVIGVSRPPVLDCVTTFHPDYTAAGTDLRLLRTVSEISPIWRPKRLVTLLNL